MILSGTVVSCLLLAYSINEYRHRPASGRNVGSRSDPEHFGVPRIGGDFSLVDQDGNPVTWASLRGSWLAIYFGFIRCPEVCPAQMSKMATAVRLITENSKVQVPWKFVFISCDPARDNIGLIKEYLSDFQSLEKTHNVKVLGLVGTPELTGKAMSNWRIYASVPEPEEIETGEYIVDHSIACYWFDPAGRFVSMHGPKYKEEHMAAELIPMVERITRDPHSNLY